MIGMSGQISQVWVNLKRRNYKNCRLWVIRWHRKHALIKQWHGRRYRLHSNTVKPSFRVFFFTINSASLFLPRTNFLNLLFGCCGWLMCNLAHFFLQLCGRMGTSWGRSTKAHSWPWMVILLPTFGPLPATTNKGWTQDCSCLPVLKSAYFEVVENWQINCAGRFEVSNAEQVSCA